MKINVRDKVKIMRKGGIDQYTTYGFEVGKEYEVRAINGDRICICKENGTTGFISIYNVKLTQKYNFTKSDLKDGDIVTRRDGEKGIVIKGKVRNLKDSDFFIKLSDCTKELKNKVNGNECLDFVKVERPVKYETVFERVEEEKKEILDKVEKNYLARVIKPFRDKVECIIKQKDAIKKGRNFLTISIKNDIPISFPDFDKNTMYKGMEVDKKYTLEDLGI